MAPNRVGTTLQFIFYPTGMVVPIVDANARMSAERAADLEVSGISKPPEVAGDLRNRAFIGTSGWAYSSWKPGFYPQALPQRKFLQYYGSQLNSVEGNYTIRQLPIESMLTVGWPRLAPTFASRSKRRSGSITSFGSRTAQTQSPNWRIRSLR